MDVVLFAYDVYGSVSGRFDRGPLCGFRSETFLKGMGTPSESPIREDGSGDGSPEVPARDCF